MRTGSIDTIILFSSLYSIAIVTGIAIVIAEYE